jgi:GH15 family glucan-1,4-alpha-glucosidase
VRLQANSFPKIQDYAIIGDCRSAALVSLLGSIEWLCWPRYDSASIFAAILDRQRGGHWKISPSKEFVSERSYIDCTNVLQTRFMTSTGTAELTDLMPVDSEVAKARTLLPDHQLIRRVVCTKGEIEIAVDFYPRAKYGMRDARLKDLSTMSLLRADVGRGAYWLKSSIPLSVEDGRARTVVRLHEGECVEFSLTYAEESPAVLPVLGDRLREQIDRSVKWWEGWADHCRYDGPYRAEVLRSALVLKLLAYAPSGAITAAPTTSLPELIGGDLNWDYRYCWLRDASLTVRALVRLGFVEEADSFLDWLLHATHATQPKLNVLYSIFGTPAADECCLPHLSGYAGSKPVRIGNEAQKQLQLDIYGEVIEASAQFVRAGGHFDREAKEAMVAMGKYVAGNWHNADEGIWEPRTGRKHHTHSKLMCWVALDRLIEMQHRGELDGVPLAEFAEQRRRIQKEIHHRAWNDALATYVSTIDGTDTDATLLLIPWYGFEPADSSRMKRTYKCIVDELGASDSLLYRYKRTPPEGAFGICSFWGAEYLVIGGGTLQEGKRQFERLLEFQNDVGLYGEQIDPDTGDALGNFPQAFTHIGLINCALSLHDRQLGRSHEEEISTARVGPPEER